jgi:hypothetical protein
MSRARVVRIPAPKWTAGTFRFGSSAVSLFLRKILRTVAIATRQSVFGDREEEAQRQPIRLAIHAELIDGTPACRTAD